MTPRSVTRPVQQGQADPGHDQRPPRRRPGRPPRRRPGPSRPWWSRPGSPSAELIGPRSVTRTVNRPPSLIDTSIRSVSPCRRCRATARVQASPMASRTSSSSSSATPARRATAAADQPDGAHVRGVRGEGQLDGRHRRRGGGHGGAGQAPVRAACADPPVVASSTERWISKTESRPGDPEDLEQPLVGADQAERAVTRPQPPVRPDEHAESGRVQEVHPRQVDDHVPGARRRPARAAVHAAAVRCRRRSRHRPPAPRGRPRSGSPATAPSRRSPPLGSMSSGHLAIVRPSRRDACGAPDARVRTGKSARRSAP